MILWNGARSLPSFFAEFLIIGFFLKKVAFAGTTVRRAFAFKSLRTKTKGILNNIKKFVWDDSLLHLFVTFKVTFLPLILGILADTVVSASVIALIYYIFKATTDFVTYIEIILTGIAGIYGSILARRWLDKSLKRELEKIEGTNNPNEPIEKSLERKERGKWKFLGLILIFGAQFLIASLATPSLAIAFDLSEYFDVDNILSVIMDNFSWAIGLIYFQMLKSLYKQVSRIIRQKMNTQRELNDYVFKKARLIDSLNLVRQYFFRYLVGNIALGLNVLSTALLLEKLKKFGFSFEILLDHLGEITIEMLIVWWVIQSLGREADKLELINLHGWPEHTPIIYTSQELTFGQKFRRFIGLKPIILDAKLIRKIIPLGTDERIIKEAIRVFKDKTFELMDEARNILRMYVYDFSDIKSTIKKTIKDIVSRYKTKIKAIDGKKITQLLLIVSFVLAATPAFALETSIGGEFVSALKAWYAEILAFIGGLVGARIAHESLKPEKFHYSIDQFISIIRSETAVDRFKQARDKRIFVFNYFYKYSLTFLTYIYYVNILSIFVHMLLAAGALALLRYHYYKNDTVKAANENLNKLLSQYEGDIEIFGKKPEDLKPKAYSINSYGQVVIWMNEPYLLKAIGWTWIIGIHIIPLDGWRPLKDRIKSGIKKYWEKIKESIPTFEPEPALQPIPIPVPIARFVIALSAILFATPAFALSDNSVLIWGAGGTFGFFALAYIPYLLRFIKNVARLINNTSKSGFELYQKYSFKFIFYFLIGQVYSYAFAKSMIFAVMFLVDISRAVALIGAGDIILGFIFLLSASILSIRMNFRAGDEVARVVDEDLGEELTEVRPIIPQGIIGFIKKTFPWLGLGLLLTLMTETPAFASEIADSSMAYNFWGDVGFYGFTLLGYAPFLMGIASDIKRFNDQTAQSIFSLNAYNYIKFAVFSAFAFYASGLFAILMLQFISVIANLPILIANAGVQATALVTTGIILTSLISLRVTFISREVVKRMIDKELGEEPKERLHIFPESIRKFVKKHLSKIGLGLLFTLFMASPAEAQMNIPLDELNLFSKLLIGVLVSMGVVSFFFLILDLLEAFIKIDRAYGKVCRKT